MKTYKKLDIRRQTFNFVKKFVSLIYTFLTFQLFVFFPTLYCSIFEPYFLPYSAEEVVYMQAINVLSEGEESCGKNPAGCALENKKSVSFGYTCLNFKDNLSSIKLFLPGKFSNLGFLLRYADFGDTEFVSENFDIAKEDLYSLILNTSLGKEIFLPGLFFGVDLNFGNVKLDKTTQTFGCSFGTKYIFNFVSTELHFASNISANFAEDENLFFYAFGLKYYIPEYKSFLSIGYNDNIDKFVTLNIETEFTKSFTFIIGYETTIDSSLTNYSFAVNIKKRPVEIVGSTKYNPNFCWTTGVSINFLW